MQPPSSKRPCPAEWKAGSRRGRSRPKKVRATEDNAIAWRLIDDEFDQLHKEFNFTVEACCDPQGLNGHAGLPYYSTQNSFLNNDVSGHTIFLNAPWKIAHKCIQHIRKCHSEDPKGTKAVIILPDWPSFREVTSDLKLLKTIPSRQHLFTKSPDNDASLRTPVDSFRWPVNYWVIDKDTPVLSEHNVREQNVPSDDATETESAEAHTSEIDETEVNPDIIAQNAANKYLPAAAAYVIMNPDHPEPLMRVPVKINDQETDALIDNAATLNFVSKSFIDEHKFHEFCAKAPKVAVRVANSQRVASWKVFVPKSLIINGTDYSGIQFRVLPPNSSSAWYMQICNAS